MDAASIVSVGFPAAIAGLYDYRIPRRFQPALRAGMPVLVEVRKKAVWGIAVRLKQESAYPLLKEVIEIREGQWTEAYQRLIGLYEWIASYYQCDIGRVFRPLIRRSQQTAASRGPAAGKRREPAELANTGGPCRATLTDEQTRALEFMAPALVAPAEPFLLHGITGSGKTFVYIELARRALDIGKGVIILVPEIALTPQTVARFCSGIGSDIAVIHSSMTEAERRNSLEALVTGKKRLVIGARSAILAPVENLGLIVVDEEHDGSYKQSETDPRYHARDVAIMRGKLQRAAVVLGSATPCVESYYNACSGKYRLVRLDRRFGLARLPKVAVVDMNEERRANNWTFLSQDLRARIGKTLDSKRQCILLLNRRGFSASLICKDCGHTHQCVCCSVKLAYHSCDGTLKCHQCGYERQAPDACPACGGGQIKYRGTGIQKAEALLRQEFPQARIVRMDRDSTRRRGAHVSIVQQFAQREADILLGTQMVAKGLDFPGVALVGVLHADVGLSIPDFRASERTFQLLAQVAGRAGREDDQGEVVIQTFFPREHAVLSAQWHDYNAFYTAEIEQRKRLGYPPFRRLGRVVVEGPREPLVRHIAASAAACIAAQAGEQAAVLGPAPAAIARIENRFRYSLLVKARSNAVLAASLAAVRRRFSRPPRGMKLTIDVDPQNML